MKKRVLSESFRVLADGGELHISDWGKPQNILMRILFYPVQLLDGFSNTRENVQGMLPELIMDAGAGEVVETARFSTLFGTLRLLCAIA